MSKESEKPIQNPASFLRQEAKKYGISDEEIDGMESMRGMSHDQLNEKINQIEREINNLEATVKALKHEKGKLSMKWLEDNPV
jgi:VIT1/CCC1 family predicted Fe2+/Mn2+ transporter